MAIKLFDSELKVMDVLWKEGDKTAKQISDILKEEIGWNMNTTYTVIKSASQKVPLSVANQTSCACADYKRDCARGGGRGADRQVV